MKLLIFFLLCGAPLLTVARELQEFYHKFGFPSLYDFTCTAPGTYCSKWECDTVYLCLPSSQSSWTAIPSKCNETNKETCNNGKCSTIPSAACANEENRNFKCESSIGIYPDPFNCTVFHICAPAVGIVVDDETKPEETPISVPCPDGYGYNPLTTYCDRTLTNGNCPTVPEVAICRNVLDNGAVFSNSVLYYICLPYDDNDSSLYPHLYMCPNGKKYQGNFRCA